MPITCGNCHSKHDTVDAVRACHGHNPPRYQQTPPLRTVPETGATLPTARQLSLAQALLTEREHATAITAEMLPAMSRRELSVLIDDLLRVPKRLVQCTPTSTSSLTGTYTVVLGADDDEYITLKFEAGAKWADGKTVVSFLSGPDNEIAYTGFASLEPAGLRIWKRFKEDTRLVAAAQFLLTGNVDEAHERFLNLAEAYALRSGRCMRCGHKLTVPTSLHRGLGPDCAGREGVAA